MAEEEVVSEDELKDGYVEDVITPSATRAKLASALDMLIGKRVQRLPKKHNNLFI